MVRKAKAVIKVRTNGLKKRPSQAPDVPEQLFMRGRCDRDTVKSATSMTREEWQKHQEGQGELWPQPSYMCGEKGHMSFRDETYSIITRWTAETQIEYRPHAKAPGSKSHLRYERYSLARTVGEALELSSYPADWCWDYERGFIRVVGGPVRDEPLDITKAEDESSITAVDRAINAWYARELAKELGMKVSEITASAGWGESQLTRGLRLLAQREARQRLEAAEREGRSITDEEVLRTLQRWPFYRNPWRKNVMQEGQEWVFSDTLGLLRDRQGDLHLTAPTRRYPQVAELFARWLTDRLPPGAGGFKFTSMNVNCNYAAALHRDLGNFGHSFIHAFGSFSGGKLQYWPSDTGGPLAKLPKNGSVTLDLQRDLVLFNGNCAHAVENFSGARYTIVYFTVGCYAQVNQEDRDKLHRMGIRCPEPSHNVEGLPPWRCYPVADLELRKVGKSEVEAKRAGAKRRLPPEDAKSFYRNDQRRARLEAE